jgi:WD40 repeat protein
MLNLLIFISPIAMLIIAGILIRTRGNPETSGRRYFLFLAWASIGSLGLILLNWILPPSPFGVVTVLFPIIPGLIVLTLLHRREWDSLNNRTKILILFTVIILLMATIVQIVTLGRRSEELLVEPVMFGMLLFAITVFLFIAWKWGNRFSFLFGMLAILYLTVFNVLEMGSLSLPFEAVPGWKFVLGLLAYLTIPGFVIPVMAILTVNILDRFSNGKETNPMAWRPIIGRLVFVLVLYGSLLYSFYWLWLWDGIDDGIRGFLMIGVSAIAAISACLVMVMTVSGWRRWAGPAFAILVMVPIYLAATSGMGMEGNVSNYTVTEERAAQLEEAIESHRAINGTYPVDLDELVPGELLRIPLPMIMPGQGWCYQGGSNYYRLGAVYREHWSSPYREVRVYASAGNVPEGNWECDEKLAEEMAQSSFFGPPPTPVPLPISDVSVPRVTVEPLLQTSSFSTGDWSPDGSYLVFGLTEYSMTDGVEHVTIDLRFLDARTGEICQPSQSQWTVRQSNGLRDHSAWLPDGRLLFVTDAGEMLAFHPCVDEVENLASRYPVKFTHAVSYDAGNGRVLLKNGEAYWLLDGISLKMRNIEGIPTESYRPWYDWSPDGERLAISWMSGPQVEDEAFLYIVDWASGEVTTSLPLEGASDAYLPIVEWLTRDELLLHGDKLTVLDFGSDPPVTTDVLKDIFLLDIAYPNDVSSMDSVRVGEEYYLGVQVNHPRNQDGYVYSSKTGQVEIFQHDVSSLLFFDEGQWMRLTKWEDEPSYRDEYMLVWMDQPNEPVRFKLEGHVPRAHPQIFPRYLPNLSQLVFHSSQGISLVSIPDGGTLGFWDLSNKADYFDVIPAPNGGALIVASGGDGLYYIPLAGK